MTFGIANRIMLDLENAVQRALSTGDESGIQVIGYGEVTLVLLLHTDAGDFACKRLPVFPNAERFERYRASLDEYLARLAAAGVDVAPTELWSSVRADRSIVAYCIQRALPRERVGHKLLHAANDDEAMRFFERVLAVVNKAVTPTLGIDSQAANWVEHEGRLIYLDVTTPLMRDEQGRERLDVKLFMSSLPVVLRDVVRVTMSKSIFDKFYSTRGAMLDLLGNLHKEKLARLIPPYLERVNRVVDRPITEADARAYYDEDAKMWALIQRLRRTDKWLQSRVLRRTYPFLLPPPIAR